MQFLGVLRNKYLAMASKEDITFKSVILGGVYEKGLMYGILSEDTGRLIMNNTGKKMNTFKKPTED